MRYSRLATSQEEADEASCLLQMPDSEITVDGSDDVYLLPSVSSRSSSSFSMTRKLFSEWRVLHEKEQSNVEDDESSIEVVMGSRSITWLEKKTKEKNKKHTNGPLQQHLIDCDCGPGRGMRTAHSSLLLYIIRELAPNRKKLEGFRLTHEIREDPTCGFTMTKDFYQVVRLGKGPKCHAGLLAYHQKSRLIVIYDSDLSRVNKRQFAKEIYTPWVRAVFGRHFADTIPVYMNVGFELQPEDWSCAFRSFAGLLALLQEQSPCGAVNIMEVVRFVRRVTRLEKVGWEDLTSLEWRMEPTRFVPTYAPSAADPNLVRVDFPNRRVIVSTSCE